MSSLKSPSNNSSVSSTIDPIISQIQSEFSKVLERIKKNSPEDHIITIALCLFVTVICHWIFKNKEESLISFTVIISTILFALLIAAIHGLPWFHQYSSSLVLFSLLDSLGLLYNSPLILAAFPLLIEHLRGRVLAIAKRAK
jgi:hypothetical protein